MVSVWTSLPLHLLCTCHALAARKYWCVMSDLNPNISSAASLWLEQTPSFHGLRFCFFSWVFIYLKSYWFYSSCIIYLFFIRTRTSFWADCFFGVAPLPHPSVWHVWLIHYWWFAMITRLKAAAQNGWCLSLLLQYLLVSNSHCGLGLDGWLHVSCCTFVRVGALPHSGWRLSFQLSAQDMAAWLRKRLF